MVSKEELVAQIVASKISGPTESVDIFEDDIEYRAKYDSVTDIIILTPDEGTEHRYYFNDFILEVLQGGFTLEN